MKLWPIDFLPVCATVSGSYFLNCSWKRSLWPWRVSAGRPASTHKHTHTYTSVVEHEECSGAANTSMLEYTHGWWDLWMNISKLSGETLQIYKNASFSETEKRLLQMHFGVHSVGLWKLSWAQGVREILKLRKEHVISESFEEKCHFKFSHFIFCTSRCLRAESKTQQLNPVLINRSRALCKNRSYDQICFSVISENLCH